MNSFLNQIGITVSSSSLSSKKLYVIKNPDGSPRWIWNVENKRPDFLRFYSTSSLSSKLLVNFIYLVFKFKFQPIVFRKSILHVSVDNTHVLSAFTSKDFALFTGTDGPNRKLILYSENQFFKIALNENSTKLIDNEFQVLTHLKESKSLNFPKPKKISNQIISLSDLGVSGKRSNIFSSVHAQAVLELSHQYTQERMEANQSISFKKSHEYLTCLSITNSGRIPLNLITKLRFLQNELSGKELRFCFAHKDFTPWNCFVQTEKINLYDFELAEVSLPFAFDAFHFVLQQGILVDHLPWKSIKPKLKSAFELIEKYDDQMNWLDYFKAYLLINLSYYFKVYDQQEKWHQQIYWFFRTWNDALTDLLSSSQNSRKDLIDDILDWLHFENYAALKFPNISPRDLSEFSDIDILLKREVAIRLVYYLKNHSLVSQFSTLNQSHMITIFMVTREGKMLSLDLIWKLKRKALEFMNVDKALNFTLKNDFGVKTLTDMDTKHFLKCFYGLNNSDIPVKYSHFFTSEYPNLQSKQELLLSIKKMPQNKYLNGFLNKCNYFMDYFRRIVHQKGLIITFSGVDGAGKSTIIERTKELFEKKFRKKVVVIRHRPSLFPILSAITLGKEQAEKNAANNLPRKGNNSSFLSSLLRFFYYFFDYLIGQFYVYIKHVLRGEIVLYDRYYFDFINDSVRSNIRLPKSLLKLGYWFLLKPQLNFFLYADPEIILSRKRELEADTIVQLTQDYLALFYELEKRGKGRYFPIENIDISSTLEMISEKIQDKILKDENSN